MNILGFLAPIFGFIMEGIYKVIPNYGWAIIIFTIITKIITFPLEIKQQKSSARMAAYQPMMAEIQKKWAKDKERMNEELMKFQQENGVSMTAGCLPMVINMLVIFGVIQVVYRPMQYVMRISTEAISACIEVANAAGASLQASNYTVQNTLINLVKADPAAYASALGDKLVEVQNFNFTFCGIDLSLMPQLGFNVAIIIPVLSVVTMLVSQIIMMRTSGQSAQMQGSMKAMMWVMPLMFAWFAFTVPVGFSLYYTVSNILVMGTSFIKKAIFDPEVIKQQIQQEVEERRAAKRKKKQVTLTTETGEVVEKEVSEDEMARIRLARARALDEEKYKDE